MAKLTIRLLGAFHASLDAKPVTQFESNKVRALLAYLAVETGQAHRREKLAALLWPEMREKRARSNLSQALYNLRHLIQDQAAQPPYLNLTNTTVQFNVRSEHWCDAIEFPDTIQTTKQHKHPSLESCHECIESLQSAADLYRGDFLQGLTLGNNLEFEEWRRITSERFFRQAIRALKRLTAYYENQGQKQNAIRSSWRQVEFNPIDEAGHRQLMRLLAADGQRNQAIAQFQRLKLLLSEELGVAPEGETVVLYERLRQEAHSPAQDQEQRHNLPAPLTPFIGREVELRG
ncbi:BTAD domain-containing putative transcriptional regulator, partial [Chloroflexota bacterium]